MIELDKGSKRIKGMYALEFAPPKVFHASGGKPSALQTWTATVPLITSMADVFVIIHQLSWKLTMATL